MANKERLLEILEADNVLDVLDEADARKYGEIALEGYEEDLQDERRLEKVDRWEQGQDLIRQTVEAKNTPFQNAANIKYPLMTTACIQFNSRAYPGIVQGNSVAKPKVFGSQADPAKIKRAEQVCEFINWQLFNEIEEWEEETDRLLLMLPAYGTMFRKVWLSNEKRRIQTKVLSPERVIVPYDAESLELAPRVSEKFSLPPRRIEERVRTGYYYPVEYDDEDKERDEEFLCQYTYLDLDDDGYKEPYEIVIHVESGTVVRISPNFKMDDIIKGEDDEILRIKEQDYFIKYSFIPSPDGSFYDLGFFDLLYPINQTVNTVLNQLLDAGTLANSNGGFISNDLKMRKRGPLQFEIGKFIGVNGSGEDIRKGIVPMDFPGPSPTLFQLLGFIIEAGRDIANLKEVLEGQQDTQQTATTTMALIEQGLKVFSAIYKRIHRSLAKELQLIRYWNHIIANPMYDTVMDAPEGVNDDDFKDDDLDFVPVSDPSVVTDMQRMARVQFRMQFMNDPYFNQIELRKQIWEGAGMEGFEQIQSQNTPESQQIQQLSELVQKLSARLQEMQSDKAQEQLNEMRADEESRARVKKDLSQAVKNIADAEAAEEGTQLDIYQRQLESMNESQNGRTRRMASQPNNAVPGPGLPVGPGAGQGSPEQPQGGRPDPGALLAAITPTGAE